MILLSVLGLLVLWFLAVWLRDVIARKELHRPSLFQLIVGALTNFFDTLGIGSYATTTALFRLRKVISDELIPGTMTVGHAIPIAAQAFIYITIVEVEVVTLFSMIGASILGAWLGAGVVTKLNRQRVQLGMGLALLFAAGLMLARMFSWLPDGGNDFALSGTVLIMALVGNFAFGALMTIGVGAYAPIMIMVSLLGMNPKAAFPIMMGSCAFLMPVAGYRFIKSRMYSPKAAAGLTLGGIPAVLLAAYIVKELPLETVRTLVVIVVLYTSASMLISSRRQTTSTRGN